MRADNPRTQGVLRNESRLTFVHATKEDGTSPSPHVCLSNVLECGRCRNAAEEILIAGSSTHTTSELSRPPSKPHSLNYGSAVDVSGGTTFIGTEWFTAG
ncbi:hypothetical protein ACKU27_26655 [Sphingobium yanoikuyae]|uniref:hypothetical protein n=1 Tax=Sphingobium yanoikuyae TaxID=13690 RepID=UPI003B90571D